MKASRMIVAVLILGGCLQGRQGQGWYMMVPPLTKDGFAQTSVSMSQWQTWEVLPPPKLQDRVATESVRRWREFWADNSGAIVGRAECCPNHERPMCSLRQSQAGAALTRDNPRFAINRISGARWRTGTVATASQPTVSLAARASLRWRSSKV
jgi:hypothetical protein